MNFWAGLKKTKKKVGGSPADGSKKILNTIFNLQPRRERERERELTIEQFHSCVVRDLRDHSSN